MDRRKHILVTGGAGFIGYHVCLALAERGDLVVGYDNFNDYYSPILKRARAERLAACQIPVEEGDICDLEQMAKIVEQHGITHVVHLAAQAGVRYSLDNPQAYVKNNVEGFVQVLELCRRYPQIALTYASSSSVYGMSERKSFAEGDRTDAQVSLYGATKKSNELLAHTYHYLFGIRVTGLRYFTVYGPWGRPDMAYFAFTEAILAGRPISLYNGGKMVRDFTYIDDIVSGTLQAIDREDPCEIYNLGNHQPIPLLEFIHILEKILDKRTEIELLPMQKGDVLTTCADLTKAHASLSFAPKTVLEIGLRKFVDWYLSFVHDSNR